MTLRDNGSFLSSVPLFQSVSNIASLSAAFRCVPRDWARNYVTMRAPDLHD
jgi:hypothetical protein